MENIKFKIFCLFIVILVIAGNVLVYGQAGLAAVWANDGSDKVTRDELRASLNPDSMLNRVWDGEKIYLFGARNEVVAFNLILEAPLKTADNITVSFDTLTGPEGIIIGSILASQEDVFNWVNRDIELFYVRYLQIKGLSTDLFFGNYDERHIPKKFQRPWTGNGYGSGTWEDRPDHDKFYPDIAIPLELISGFNITAGENQSIWVDIYIPKTSPSGTYQGIITIQENGSTTNEISVNLEVRDFILPDLPNAKTMIFYSFENINNCYLGILYPDFGSEAYTQSLALADKHFQIAHRHKMSLIDGSVETEQMDEAWTARLTGDLFTPAEGYEGIGVGVGNNVYSIGTYGSWSWQGGGQSAMWTHTNAWVNWFDTQNLGTPTDYFVYLIDESDDYPQIEKWAEWMDNNPGPGQRLMSMATIALPTAVVNTPSLDIPTSGLQVGITDVWQYAADNYVADSEKFFYFYNGTRPASGTFAIEDNGVALRVSAWAQYKKKIDRWFYWESTYYNNFQGNTGQTNIFQRAQTFGNFDRVDAALGETGWNYLNGDGVLFYPGTDTRYPNDSYGIAGPFVSLRMKYWRRGIQDVDYLTLAAEINQTRTAEIVNQMISKVLWEYGVEDQGDPTWVLTDISWSIDPDVWEEARAELADIIAPQTGVNNIDEINPDNFILYHNYPNPFNSETFIDYKITLIGQDLTRVKLLIFNVNGQMIRTLVDEEKPSGKFQVGWDGKNKFGERAASGIYLYKITAGNFSVSKKMVVLK